ncbi:MAG: metallophosphoesterase [Chloroflexota bacterium]
MLQDEIVYFVQISDSHIGPSVDYERHGHNPYKCLAALVEHINGLPTKPDFIIHTGDVVTDPDSDSYRLAADVFSNLHAPIYFVNGNHDKARDIHRFLPMGPKQILSKNLDVLTYAFEVKNYRFLVIDARGPDEIDPHGLLSDEMLTILRSETSMDGPPLTLFSHFPVQPMNSIWMDAYMLIINGQKMHEMLVPIRERVRGVFYGHIHQNMQTLKDGILYVAAGSTFSQFSAWPDDATTGFDPLHPPAYNFVHLMPKQTIIHQHVIPRP